AGAFAENLNLKTYLGLTKTYLPFWNNLGGVKILGDRTTLVRLWPLDYNQNNVNALNQKTPWLIDGFSFERGTYSQGVHTINQVGAPVYLGKVNFGDFGGAAHMLGDVRITEDYTISGGA